MPARFDNVSDQIFRGGKPSPTDLQILSDVYGIKRIVSLDGKIGSEIAPLVKSLGMEHIVIPIGGPESEPLINFLKDSVAALLEKQPVYIHCRHGRDRTGMAVAIFRIQSEGWSPEKALKEAKAYDFGEGLSAEVEELYTNAIYDESETDSSMAHDNLFFNSERAADFPSDDIVGAVRGEGDNPPAFTQQQSFAPEIGKSFDPFGEEIESNPMVHDSFYFNRNQKLPESKLERRRKLRKLLLEELSSDMVPPVGMYDNYKGIRGAGPGAGSGDAGGFSYSEPSLIPGGAGAVETGNILNL